MQSQASCSALRDPEFTLLAQALTLVRRKVPFALCGYCFMPDHGHAIGYLVHHALRVPERSGRSVNGLSPGPGSGVLRPAPSSPARMSDWLAYA
jgi:hypothetical protein